MLLAKIGLDGHDRGVKVLARSLRDCGFDVIYTGLWQTAAATMQAAMQEDVDVVGVSLLSAAHMTIMPEIFNAARKLGIEGTPVVLGGIVPQSDYGSLKEMGVAAVFNPGSPLDRIIASMRQLAASRPRETPAALRAGYETGRPLALARLITHVQRSGGLNGWTPPRGAARVIGVTGAPGVGKSSFIGKLSADLRGRGLKVAVLAVDPSSPITGGALLGDRLRMMSGELDDGFFIRSMASGEVHDGLGPRCAEILRLMAGFGFDVILLETVGAGQADVGVHKLTDRTLLLLMPDSGDAIQFSKAGIMEIASAFVVNKCDLPGADATLAHLRSALDDDRPIWSVSTLRNQGIEAAGDWIEALRGRPAC
ncbi:MAG TPA: cobalamin-dependent protein [Phycisphaerae bacterium]